MRYWNDNRKSCEHVEPREDWREPVERWIDWMDAIGRTNETMRTRWYQIVRFSQAVDKSITDVTEDDLIFYLAGMGTEGKRGARSAVKVVLPMEHEKGNRKPQPRRRDTYRPHDAPIRPDMPGRKHRTGARVTGRGRQNRGDAGSVLRPAPDRDGPDQPQDRP